MSEVSNASLPLVIVACLARDLDSANLLSEASRKAIWNLLAEHRGSSTGKDGSNVSPAEKASLDLLASIAPAGDG